MTVRNFIICLLVPIALIYALMEHPVALKRALGVVPVEHAPRLG